MDARPFSNAPQDFISPCDARRFIRFMRTGSFEIKTQNIRWNSFRDRKLANGMRRNVISVSASVDATSISLWMTASVQRNGGLRCLHTVNPAANDFARNL